MELSHTSKRTSERNPKPHKGRQTEAAENIAQPGHDKDHAKPRQPRQGPGGLAIAELEALGEQVKGKAQRHFDDCGEPAGRPGEIRFEPGHEGANPVLERNDQAIGIFGQRRQGIGKQAGEWRLQQSLPATTTWPIHLPLSIEGAECAISLMRLLPGPFRKAG